MKSAISPPSRFGSQFIASFTHPLARRASRWAAFALCAGIAFAALPAQAAVTEAWVQRYHHPPEDSTYYNFATAVAVDRSGNVVVTGRSSYSCIDCYFDYYTAKYAAANGALLWEKRYDGPGRMDDSAQALALDASGNVVVTGFSDGGGFNADFYTAKYAASDGALIWEKRYDGPGSVDDYALALALDANGNVLVIGTSNGDYYTAKYAAADGALLWEKRYHSPGTTGGFANAVAVDSIGNVVVTGSLRGPAPDYLHDYYTAKYAAADGALFWEKHYNGPANDDDTPRAVAVDADGNVLVTGQSRNGSSNYDYYTAKYAAADGALLWEKRYNGSANGEDEPSAVAVDGSGNVVVTGYSGNGTNYDYYTAKYAAANGALLWEHRYNGPGNSNDLANAVAVDASGNVVVVGNSMGSGGGYGWDYYTAKYAAADGALLWEKRYDGPASGDDYAHALALGPNGTVAITGSSIGSNGYPEYATVVYREYVPVTESWVQRYNGPANSNDFANAVAVDAGGNVVVTGASDNGTNWDYYTAKYAAADGALLWEKRYNGPANSYDEAYAVALDGSGNVIVTGSSISIGSEDYYTAKYAAADGALLWEHRYNGPGDDEDDGNAVAVDGSGNVIVTGQSYRLGSKYDYYTAKYAAADGALLWEKRYNGPGNDSDVATAVALDRSGNVVVTGYSIGNGSGYDYYTAKYGATNGALLWEHRYNGPANSNDFANAVAVDASGNVAVTGDSYNGTNFDYYTAKYAAADGALLWEKRYNGPANGDDRAYSIAVDASGNVVVTGGSVGTNFSDYYTAKYAASDGALLWEKRYNGPSNDEDHAYAVAVDASGDVVVTGSAARPDDDDGTDYYTAKYAAADGALLWERRYHGPLYGYDSAVSLALGPNGMVAVTGHSDAASFSSILDYATVVYRENLPAVFLDRVLTGIRLRFPGVAGHGYQVLRAPTVTGPWSTIATLDIIANGIIEYIDTDAPPGSAFYRTVAAP